MKRWYAAQCKPLQDARAARNLIDQGYTVLHPLARIRRRRAGRVRQVVESLFPRYLFMQLDNCNENWAPIRSTPGICGLVRFGGCAVPVPDAVVRSIRERLDPATGCVDLATDLRPEQKIRITEGPFAGQEGLFLARTGEERVIVLLNVMQQAQRLQLPECAVESA